jgi:hypothetical protein
MIAINEVLPIPGKILYQEKDPPIQRSCLLVKDLAFLKMSRGVHLLGRPANTWKNCCIKWG